VLEIDFQFSIILWIEPWLYEVDHSDAPDQNQTLHRLDLFLSLEELCSASTLSREIMFILTVLVAEASF
jgi:hypothetical protein